MSKPYFYRDGPIVDGAPSRQPYVIAELSDVPSIETPVSGLAVTFAGTAGSTMTSSAPIRTWADVGKFHVLFRPAVNLSTANGWNRILLPIANGFQPPIIKPGGTYRYSGDPSNRHVRAARMANEMCWWSGSTSVYLDAVGNRNAAAREYVHILATYIRS